MVTDMWGYVPYSQALQGDAAKQITDPKYDSQQSIYMDLVTKLKSYIAMINPSGSSISQDQIYGGNVTEWQKFGNSLLLRLYMRMQVADPSAAKAGIQSIISSGAPIFTSDADNAYFHYQPDPYENRVYSWFITREDFKVNQTIVDTLKNLNDPRLPVYAVPVRDTSMKSDNPFTYPDSAYVGYPSSVSSGTIPTAQSSDIGAYFISPTSPGFLMTYAEVEFIKAEAAARGWISGGPTAAANYYDAGITASMDQFTASNMSSILNSLTNTAVYQNLSLLKNEYPQGITSAQIKTYLQQSSVAYPTSGSLNQQLQAIAKQKWIAMYGQGFEGWSCWRRTQMPVLMPGPNAIFQGANKVPLRMFYPPVEQSLNPTNYKAAVAAQGPDNETTGLLTKIWWEGGK